VILVEKSHLIHQLLYLQWWYKFINLSYTVKRCITSSSSPSEHLYKFLLPFYQMSRSNIWMKLGVKISTLIYIDVHIDRYYWIRKAAQTVGYQLHTLSFYIVVLFHLDISCFWFPIAKGYGGSLDHYFYGDIKNKFICNDKDLLWQCDKEELDFSR
jgi:hypothetical protein